MGLSSCTRSERKINIRVKKKLDTMKLGSRFFMVPGERIRLAAPSGCGLSAAAKRLTA